MKKITGILLLMLIVWLTACVQKVYHKTVMFELDTKEEKKIYTIGLRGNDRPLSWRIDSAMTAVKKDTSYRLAITFKTGYKFTEVKFVINDGFEFENETNRKVVFAEGDTTVYKAIFNKR